MLILALALAAVVPADASECVYRAVPPERRTAIGETLVAGGRIGPADAEVLARAADACVGGRRLAAERVVNVTGSATMRMAGEAVARELAHPEWVEPARAAIAQRSSDERVALSGSIDGPAFKLVLEHMARVDPTVTGTLQRLDETTLGRFALMIKLLALAAAEGDRASRP